MNKKTNRRSFFYDPSPELQGAEKLGTALVDCNVVQWTTQSPKEKNQEVQDFASMMKYYETARLKD